MFDSLFDGVSDLVSTDLEVVDHGADLKVDEADLMDESKGSGSDVKA